MQKLDVHFSSRKDDWGTPQPLYNKLENEFGFRLDVCATADNAKCERFYSPNDDALSQQWTGICWMNPPYGRQIGRWVQKAYEAGHSGAMVVCLVPARVDTKWWWNWCRWGEVRFLPGRLWFVGAKHAAPFPSAIVIFGPGIRPSTTYWDWRV